MSEKIPGCLASDIMHFDKTKAKISAAVLKHRNNIITNINIACKKQR